jgi:hypothetical protein
MIILLLSVSAAFSHVINTLIRKLSPLFFEILQFFFLPFEKTIMGPKKERRLSWMSRGRACFIKGSTRGANRDYNTVQSCTILKTEDEALIYIYQPIEKQLSSILSHQNEYIYIYIYIYIYGSTIIYTNHRFSTNYRIRVDESNPFN